MPYFIVGFTKDGDPKPEVSLQRAKAHAAAFKIRVYAKCYLTSLTVQLVVAGLAFATGSEASKVLGGILGGILAASFALAVAYAVLAKSHEADLLG